MLAPKIESSELPRSIGWQRKACLGWLIAGIIVPLHNLARVQHDSYLRHGQPPRQARQSGLLDLHSYLSVAHDSGQIAISYAGIKLAEGPRAPQVLRPRPGLSCWPARTRRHCRRCSATTSGWTSRCTARAAEFDVAMSLYNVNITTGQTSLSTVQGRFGAPRGGQTKQVWPIDVCSLFLISNLLLVLSKKICTNLSHF